MTVPPEALAELKRIVATWPHDRVRAVYLHRDGREEVLYDGGCKRCRRCQMEAWIKKQESILPQSGS
jgi:hypothetical protein